MKNFFFLLGCLIMFAGSSTYAQSSQKKAGEVYLGGLDTLERYISKAVVPNVTFDSDHLLFFQVNLTNKGFLNVEELYRKSDVFSEQIKRAIESVPNRWLRTRTPLRVVIPVFFSIDRDGKHLQGGITATPPEYSLNRNIKECILLPPLIFTSASYH